MILCLFTQTDVLQMRRNPLFESTGLAKEDLFYDQCIPPTTPSTCLSRLLALTSHLEVNLIGLSRVY